MPQVSIEKPAPDFALDDYTGRKIRLADFRNKHHVFLVFNRGFK